MLRSVISSSMGRRIAGLAPACVLATAGALALIGTVSAGDTRCSNATLKGTYIFATTGWSTAAPDSAGGFNRFNGAGAGTGVFTENRNGIVVAANTPATATYTINHDCTGTVVFNVAGSLAHFNVYVDASGTSFSFVATDLGSVFAGIATRATSEDH